MPEPRLLHAEQLEAKRDAARARNPHAPMIKKLWDLRLTIAKRITELTSDEEQYYNLLYCLADTDEKAAMAKCMSTNELCEHLMSLCPIHNEMDQAILDEVLDRAGYEVAKEPKEDESL